MNFTLTHQASMAISDYYLTKIHAWLCQFCPNGLPGETSLEIRGGPDLQRTFRLIPNNERPYIVAIRPAIQAYDGWV